MIRPPPRSTLFPYTTLSRSAYQSLTGSVPFDGEDSFSIGYKHIMEEIPAPPLETYDQRTVLDRKSTRLNSSHGYISYAVFCLKKKKEFNYIFQVVELSYNLM